MLSNTSLGESQDHHWPIVETLTAFVREKARLPYPDHEAVERQKEDEQRAPRLPPADVQAALTVVGRRRPDRDPHGENLNLSGTNLSRANLRAAQLENANLSGAFLMHALLVEACLRNAYLSGAHLEKAILQFAELNRASLEGAHLDGAHLLGAVLDTANLTMATLSNVRLVGGDLQGVAGLTQEQLHDAWGDDTTKLPEGLTIPRCPR